MASGSIDASGVASVTDTLTHSGHSICLVVMSNDAATRRQHRKESIIRLYLCCTFEIGSYSAANNS